MMTTTTNEQEHSIEMMTTTTNEQEHSIEMMPNTDNNIGENSEGQQLDKSDATSLEANTAYSKRLHSELLQKKWHRLVNIWLKLRWTLMISVQILRGKQSAKRACGEIDDDTRKELFHGIWQLMDWGQRNIHFQLSGCYAQSTSA